MLYNQDYNKGCCFEEKKPEVKKCEPCKHDWKEDYCKCYCKCLNQRPTKNDSYREEDAE